MSGMTQEHFDDLLKAHTLIKELTRENLTLRFLAQAAWPDNWNQRLETALSDPLIQERVTVEMAQLLEDERRLTELRRAVSSFPEGYTGPLNKTSKPH